MRLVVKSFRCCSGILAETDGAGGIRMGTRTSKDEGRNDVGAGSEAVSGQERDRISLVDLHITAKVTSGY